MLDVNFHVFLLFHLMLTSLGKYTARFNISLSILKVKRKSRFCKQLEHCGVVGFSIPF